MEEYQETITWRTLEVDGQRIGYAVIGMAVMGDEQQFILADEIHVVRSAAIRHEDGAFTWTSPPKPEWRKKIEAALLELHPVRGATKA